MQEKHFRNFDTTLTFDLSDLENIFGNDHSYTDRLCQVFILLHPSTKYPRQQAAVESPRGRPRHPWMQQLEVDTGLAADAARPIAGQVVQ